MSILKFGKGNFTMVEKYIGGRECAILGLGVSNLPLANLLCSRKIPLYIYDKASAAELGAESLEQSGAHFVVADREFSGISGDLIFRSPGIRPDREGLRAAKARGAELTSEVELFLRLTSAHTFGITGSDGKTTTTTLTGLFLSDSRKGNTYVGGNIGKPLLTLCPEMSEKDSAVLELSSFQLMTLSDAPECVAITNISPNHLDWHTGMDEYIAAKKNIIGAQTRRLVTNADCPETLKIARETAGREGMEVLLFSSARHSYKAFSDTVDGAKALYVRDGYIVLDDGARAERLLAAAEINIPGKHNVENFMTAIGLTYGYVSADTYSRVARTFFGVEHRLELVRSLDGVDYYNSSIDSSPTRTAAALSAMSDRSMVLIAGGYDKKIPYAPLAEAICKHGGIHTLVLTGATGRTIESEVVAYRNAHPDCAPISIEYLADFEDAVRYAKNSAAEGDAVLLSPASASFDAFKNFAERGKCFKETVNKF